MCLSDCGYELIGEGCKMSKDMTISDLIIAMHDLARRVHEKDDRCGYDLRKLADDLARIGNRLHEKEMNND